MPARRVPVLAFFLDSPVCPLHIRQKPVDSEHGTRAPDHTISMSQAFASSSDTHDSRRTTPRRLFSSPPTTPAGTRISSAGVAFAAVHPRPRPLFGGADDRRRRRFHDRSSPGPYPARQRAGCASRPNHLVRGGPIRRPVNGNWRRVRPTMIYDRGPKTQRPLATRQGSWTIAKRARITNGTQPGRIYP